MDYYGIKLDLSRDSLLSAHGLILMKDYYQQEGETSPQMAYARAAIAWSAGDMALAQRIYDAASLQHFMFASPVLSNAPNPDGTRANRGLPISCFLNYVDDSIKGLNEHTKETRLLSVAGGGVGGHWDRVRGVSDKAPGVIPFLHTLDADMLAYRQGKTRKGSYAAYMNISHPDIEEFIEVRLPTGDLNRKCLNLHNAVNITDDFMEAVHAGKMWKLIDPNDGSVRKKIKARELWEKLLETRYRTGEPYLNFIDTANRYLNPYQKEAGLTIKGSNLCNEIHLATDENRTAVCCLSSLNLEKWDEWRDTSLVADLVTMLDNVLEYFIRNCPPELSRAQYSALRERSIGLGAMGFHSYLQANGTPFESDVARGMNTAMFYKIQFDAIKQSKWLGKMRGVPADISEGFQRNAHLLAIAPNANSSIICNTSASIEPIAANCYTHKTRAGSFETRNPHLEKVLTSYGQNNPGTWSSIIEHDGSVQHLDFLNEREKLVFKTAVEINQEWVVLHAGERQPFICQGQSVNLFFPPNAERCYVNKVHLSAHRRGLKGLYYLRAKSEGSAEKISSKIKPRTLVGYR